MIATEEKTPCYQVTLPSVDIKKIVRNQLLLRFNGAGNIGLKINLYKNYEVLALADAINSNELKGKCNIESIMVGDSYFTTHLGRDSTKLLTKEEQKWGVNTMVLLLTEVSEAIINYFPKENRPYLIGDMPDGSTNTINSAIQTASRMINAGANVIKMEITCKESLKVLYELCRHDFHVMAHIGYTPQKGSLMRYGDTLEEALAVFSLVRQLREYGACSVVLEMVSEVVNQALCKYSNNMLQIYSIFSGQAEHGGQSLNIWDSVFLPSFQGKYFPPTAEYQRSEYPNNYSHEVIKEKMIKLIDLTLLRKFPKSPPTNLCENDRKYLLNIDPWNNH